MPGRSVLVLLEWRSERPPEPILLAQDYHIDGAIITRQHEEILIVATSRNPNVRYSQLAFLCAQDPCLSMHLMTRMRTIRSLVPSPTGFINV
jgi:hypothetical protein